MFLFLLLLTDPLPNLSTPPPPKSSLLKNSLLGRFDTVEDVFSYLVYYGAGRPWEVYGQELVPFRKFIPRNIYFIKYYMVPKLQINVDL